MSKYIDKYKMLSLSTILREYFTMDDIANKISKEFNVKVKSSNILHIKYPRELEYDIDDVSDIILHALNNLIDMRLDEIENDIEDEYEFKFNRELVSRSLVDYNFELKLRPGNIEVILRNIKK